MARRMVMQFGMSDAVGPMAIGYSEQEVFLGRDLGQRRQVSERTARLVDSEVKRLLDDSYKIAAGIVEDNSELLEAIASALLERETLDRDQVEILAAGKQLPPFKSTLPPPPPAEPVSAAPTKPTPLTGPGIGDLSPSVARTSG
jgi:cell division protease FtsH